MRNLFKDHSLVGVVLILCSFAFAIFLRVFDLHSLSPWTDELASWYYLRHLDQVFQVESHSPFYYALLRFTLGSDASLHSTRLLTAWFSIGHLVLAFFLGRKIFSPAKFLIFWFLICFNPTDIVFARMARHYSMFLEGILIFILMIRTKSPTAWLCLLSALLGFIHVFALIPISMVLLWDYLENRSFRRTFLPLITSGLILLYYMARLLVLGSQQVGKNVSWNTAGFKDFWFSTWLQFFGDAYPRNQFYPVPLPLAGTLSGLLVLLLFWKRKKSLFLFLSTALLSLIVVECFTLSWINLRVNRYLIYLVPLLIYAVVDAFEDEVKKPLVFSLFFLSLSHIIWFNPLKIYPWDQEKVSLWNEYATSHFSKAQFICANPYQSAYFNLNAATPCSERVHHINTQAPLIFFDLNLNDRLVLLYLGQKMQLKEVLSPHTNGIFLFEPR